MTAAREARTITAMRLASILFMKVTSSPPKHLALRGQGRHFKAPLIGA